MGNNSLKSRYITSLTLQNDNAFFTAGLCLSNLSLDYLKKIQNTFLHPQEQAYFESLFYPRRQHSYLLGRYCAKQALNVLTHENKPTEIGIENGIFQHPVVYGVTDKNLQVSISHTDTLGAALVFPETHPMAIDVEKISKERDETILTQLTNDEKTLASTLPNDISLQVVWTIKEALSKALKCGLTAPLEVLEIKSITQLENSFLSYFKNFHQYQALSFSLPENACSIVYPKGTKLDIDIASIQNKVSKFKQ